MTRDLAKVAALITHGTGASRRLLVFEHPSGGIQVPAGSVEPGEDPAAAVLREVHEESGLTTAQIVRALGSWIHVLAGDSITPSALTPSARQTPGVGDAAHAPARPEPLRAAPDEIAGDETVMLRAESFRAAPDPSAPDVFAILRGWWVRRTGPNVDGWAPVAYQDYDHSVEPPTITLRVEGWVPADALATRLARHFYHLALPLEPTPAATWEHLAEDRYLFRYRWLRLIPRPHLVPGMDEWLATYYSDLID